ncbi:MAG: hypothetical protein QHG97_01410 [Methanolinea sp.]|jgi:hypothetical protein|nr:hypothetical protein [Methanolinea sp.]
MPEETRVWYPPGLPLYTGCNPARYNPFLLKFPEWIEQRLITPLPITAGGGILNMAPSDMTKARKACFSCAVKG